jgi:hypothetical protein
LKRTVFYPVCRLYVSIEDDITVLPYNITNKGILSFKQMDDFFPSISLLIAVGESFEGILPMKIISQGK